MARARPYLRNAKIADPDFVARAPAIGMEPRGGTPEELATFIKSEHDRWVPLLQSLNLPELERSLPAFDFREGLESGIRSRGRALPRNRRGERPRFVLRASHVADVAVGSVNDAWAGL